MKRKEIFKKIDEIKKRVEKATYGPWAWEQYGEKVNCCRIGIAADKDGNSVEGHVKTDRYDLDSEIFIEDILWRDDIGYKEGAVVNYDDADFIAHARTDIPFLIEFIKQLLKV